MGLHFPLHILDVEKKPSTLMKTFGLGDILDEQFFPFSAGPRAAPTMSFANIISTAKSEGGTEIPKMNDVGKKGKKPSRVLLSTAGGRRY